VQPDVVSYNAVINAYGWSSAKGKSKKCFEIYKTMLESYESGRNRDAKPDIITCNSVLNACAYENAVLTEADRAEIMEISIQTLEEFQSAAPTFGWPNYLTFSHVLLAISKHMPPNDRRSDLAEATFWQVSCNFFVCVDMVRFVSK
jgi:hypothetical protein